MRAFSPTRGTLALLLLLLSMTLTSTQLATPAIAQASGSAQEEPLAPLFAEPDVIQAAAVADSAQAPAVVRQRLVTITSHQLEAVTAAAQQTLLLNFFADAGQTVALHARETLIDGATLWHGTVVGSEFSGAIFIIRDGGITANIRSLQGLYQIRPLANGLHLVRQIDASQFPRDHEDARQITAEREAKAAAEVPTTAAATTASAAVTDDGTLIDVLIAYAPNARIAAGGTQAIRNRIDLVIAETNQIYANSKINTRLRLAYAYETAYNTYGSQALDLDRLTYKSDGFMDEVHVLRDTYGADLVSLWVEGGDYCGIAWIRSTAAFAFSVMDRWCAESTVTFAHELGHNFGARHDWYIDDYVDTPSYNKGTVDLTGRWISVMSYFNKCSDAGVQCNEIPYFSNSTVLYNGRATGVRQGTSTACRAYNQNNPACDAENYRVINDRAYTLANFRQSRNAVDLILTNLDLVDPVKAGDEITYQLTINNVGAQAAANVRLINQLPSGTQFVRTSNTAACSHNAGTVTCQFGTLAGRAAVAVNLVVRTTANTPPTVLNSATASTTTAESNTTNNSATASTRVQAIGTDTSVLFLSTSANGWLNLLPFADEDIVAYDENTKLWSLIFDGSDVGITTDVNGFEWLADGSLLLTLDRPTAVPGLGTVDDSDIIRFIPRTLGLTTAGTFEFYLDGSDVGLTTNGEDIDAIGFTPEGDLVISTIGAVNVGTVRGGDEDLLRFRATSLGSNSAGTWDLYFDGSDVAMTTATENIGGLWIDANSGAIYFSMAGAFAVNGLSGQGSDLSFCTPARLGNTTACTFSSYWRGADYKFGGHVIDGVALGSMPSTLVVRAAEEQGAMLELLDIDEATEEEDNPDDDLDDASPEGNSIFLPIINR